MLASLLCVARQLEAAPACAAALSCVSFFGYEFGIPTGPFPHGVAIADFNADGRLDIAVVNSNFSGPGDGSSVTILIGTGSRPLSISSFANSATHAVTGAPFAVVATDVNGDRILDLVTANYSGGTISVLRGLGSGSGGNGAFTPAAYFPAAAHPFALAAGDFNRDGIADIAVVDNACPSGGLSVLRGLGVDGSGSPRFASPTSIPLGCYAADIATGDFNRDGYLDCAVTVFGSNALDVLLGRGDGSFGPPTGIGYVANPYSIKAVDLDSDGTLDLAVALPVSGIIWYRGNGNGTFGGGSFPFGTPIGSGRGRVLAVADFNQDGRPDLVADGWNFWGEFQLALSLGPGASGPTGLTAANVYALAAADLDGDGHPDLVAAEYDKNGVTVIPGTCAMLEGRGNLVGNWNAQGVAVCTGTWAQQSAGVLGDGVGGVHVAWEDSRGGTGTDATRVFAQHLDSSGQPLWGSAGQPVGQGQGAQLGPVVAADGSGGLYVAWQDARSGQNLPFLQRIAPSGAPAKGWPLTGFQVGTSPCAALSAVPDDSGGVYVAAVSADLTRVRAYRITAAAALAPGWFPDGIEVDAVFGYTGYIRQPQTARDGHGGLLVSFFWQERCSNPDACYYTSFAIVRALAPSGVRGGGTTLQAHPSAGLPSLSELDAGRALLGFAPPDWRLQAAGITSSGSSDWGWALEPGYRRFLGPPVACPDGGGGAFVLWPEMQPGGYDLACIRLTAGGGPAPGWTAGPRLLVARVADQTQPRIVTDGAQGAWLAWGDKRSGDSDIYVINVGSDGTPVSDWPAGGRPTVSLPSEQGLPRIVADIVTGAIVVWQDLRNGTPQLFAQKVGQGIPVPVEVAVGAVSATPGRVSIQWRLPLRREELVVERRSDPHDWQRLLNVWVSGEGAAVCEDSMVVAGGRYGYRLRRLLGPQPLAGSEVWVKVPDRLRFALHGVYPNPGRADRLQVNLSLEDAAGALIEILDVGGRRIALQRQYLTPGDHRVNLPGVQLRPGVYLIRLTSGPHRASGRFAVIE